VSDANAVDELELAALWLAQGRGVALATVVRTWGSSPRAVGSHLIIAEDGAFMGSVSGGCIEGAVVVEAESVLATGSPKLLQYGVSNERAWEVGLTCGGSIQVFLEPYRQDRGWLELSQARGARQPIARVVHLERGDSCRVHQGSMTGSLTLLPETGAEVGNLLSANKSTLLETSEGMLFVQVYTPPLRLVIVGAVHIAQALAPMAHLAGFAVTVIDPRAAFASAARFPNVTLIDGWPDAASVAPDAGTAVVALSHDPKIDDPALVVALESPAFYVGALGSRKTHAKRLVRLSERFPKEILDRIHGPVGLDLGGRAAAQVAVSILAHMIQVRYKVADKTGSA